MSIELIETVSRCPVCLETAPDLPYNCKNCTCKLCSVCIVRLQEEGQAKMCPVCRRGGQWCEQVKFAGAEAEHGDRYSQSMPRAVKYAVTKALTLLLSLTVFWVTGTLATLMSGQKVCLVGCEDIWLYAMIYIFTGAVIIGVLGMILACLCMCLISVLSLGGPARAEN